MLLVQEVESLSLTNQLLLLLLLGWSRKNPSYHVRLYNLSKTINDQRETSRRVDAKKRKSFYYG
jgi:hypothetical protein